MPDLQRYGRPRRSARWLAFLFPLTLLLALLRLLARTAARALLALPRTLVDGDRLIKTMLWTTGVWFAMRLTLFHDAVFAERWFAFAWLWDEATLLFVFPHWLHGIWGSWLGGYRSGHFFSVVKPWLLLLIIWTLGLHVIVSVIAAVRIGLGPDRATPLPWPRPKAQAPLPFGFIATALSFALWLIPAFALIVALPPRTRPIWGWRFLDDPIKLLVPIWNGLLWLAVPRVFDHRMQTLIARNPEWTSEWVMGSPQNHWRGSTLETLAIEIGVITAALTVVTTVVWLLRSWTRAAGDSSDLALAPSRDAAPKRSTPGWAVIFLPITLPAALLGKAAWKSPLWLPGLVFGLACLYVASAIGLSIAIWIAVGRHDASNYVAMHYLRHWWDLSETNLRFPAHWHQRFAAIPHGKRQHITDKNVAYGVALLSLVGAAAAVPAMIALGLFFALVKRMLEGIAR